MVFKKGNVPWNRGIPIPLAIRLKISSSEKDLMVKNAEEVCLDKIKSFIGETNEE